MSKGKRREQGKHVHKNKYAEFSHADEMRQRMESEPERLRKEQEKREAAIQREIQEARERERRIYGRGSLIDTFGSGRRGLFYQSAMILYELSLTGSREYGAD